MARNQTLTLPLGYLTYRRTLIPDAKPTIFDKVSPKMQHSSTQKPENVFQQISDLKKDFCNVDKVSQLYIL